VSRKQSTWPQTPRQRGFALLIVLWTMTLLALLGSQVTAAGHGETRLATNLRASAVAEQAADGAVFETLWHLLDGGNGHWTADGRTRRTRVAQSLVDVTVIDEGRKMTLNNSSLPMLLSLMHAVGLDATLSLSLSDQIADWRSPAAYPLRNGAKAPQYRTAKREYGPPNQPFRSVDELALILSMTPDALARLKPYVSPYIESAPRQEGADPVIARALAEAQVGGAPPLAFDEPLTVSIVATALAPGGASFTRRAVARLNTQGLSGQIAPQYVLLDWDQGGG
jgi:general secretion pathway protein K